MSLNQYTVNRGQPLITQYIHMDSSDNAQFFFAVDSVEGSTRDFINVQLIRSSTNEIVISITGVEAFRNIYLTKGDYRIEVNTNYDQVSFVMGSGKFDAGLVTFTAVILIIFAVLMAIFWTVLPFTILSLVINSINNQGKKPLQKTAPTKTQTAQPVTVQKAKVTKPIIIHPDSWFSKLVRKDWILLAVATFFFFFLFVIESEGFGLFASIVLVAIVFYSVSEREKTKHRILVLLNHYPETTVEFLAVQLDKKKKDVISTLQIMILDDAQPIRLNLVNDTVTVVGELTIEPVVTSEKDYIVTPKELVPTLATTGTVQVQDEVMSEPEAIYHCTGCGERLLDRVKYCYSCGQKQN
ncbi:MAG: hypothetical protein ACXAB7_13540 [Candidatus Kariarchaeaceae archaeon]